jgi:hypothetical protein
VPRHGKPVKQVNGCSRREMDRVLTFVSELVFTEPIALGSPSPLARLSNAGVSRFAFISAHQYGFPVPGMTGYFDGKRKAEK